MLLANAGKVVPTEQLRETVWTNVHVTADSLPRCISSLRARLDSNDCIETHYKRGYRFQLPVERSTVDRWIERRISQRTSLPRLAILPFTCCEDVPASYGPGLAEEVMIRLGRTRSPQVEVMARDSVFAQLASGLGAQAIGVALQAEFVLTGSIVQLPQHYRLRLEMMRVADHIQLWMEDFAVSRTHFAQSASQIAGRVSARIGHTFDTAPRLPDPVEADTSSQIHVQHSSPEWRSKAFATYLDARFQWDKADRNAMEQATAGFQKALDLDPSLLTARLHQVHNYLLQAGIGYMRGDTAAELARTQAETIVSQFTSGQSVHPALGWIHFYHHRDIFAAIDAFAQKQPPGYNPWTLFYRSRFSLGRHQFSESIDLVRFGLRFDPSAPMPHSRLAWTFFLAGDRKAALEQATQTLHRFPGHPVSVTLCPQILAALDNPESETVTRAVAAAQRLTQAMPVYDQGFTTLAYILARQGKTAEARAILDRQSNLGLGRFVLRTFRAPVLAELGDCDEAIEELQLAEQQHCPWFFEILADPRLAPLHNRPDFQKLLAMIPRLETESESVA
jgi:TolB-like protein/tetratricopeptide (TPR) repeat protein